MPVFPIPVALPLAVGAALPIMDADRWRSSISIQVVNMPELVWLNGETLPLADARISVEDRGYQFADGVYEVIRIYNGRPFTLTEHLQRLRRSCDGIQLPSAFDLDDLSTEITRFIESSRVTDGMVYLQVTRGVAPRNHVFRSDGATRPTILFYTRALPPLPPPGAGEGAKLHSVPDERWKRCWIKSIALLPNVLAKNTAVAAGADEAVFVENGIVTECSASNLFAVIKGQVITHPVGPKVLPGITRLLLLDLAKQIGVPLIERPLRESEALSADELFITSTTRELSWIGAWNDKPVGGGRCGPITRKLHEAFTARVRRDTAPSARSLAASLS
jgi:D-alanine transaminase